MIVDRATLERVERNLANRHGVAWLTEEAEHRDREALALLRGLLAEGEESREPEDPGPLNMPRTVRRRGRVVWDDPRGGP